MEYVTALLAFIVALVGIHGKTWNSAANGWRRLTRTGWIVTGCALLTFMLAVVSAWLRSDEERLAREQRMMVNRIAEMEICLASGELKMAIDVLVAKAAGKSSRDGADVGFGFAELESKQTIDAIERLDLITPIIARERVGDTRPLAEFISAQTRSFASQTNMALAKYSAFLDRDLILKSTWLANHNLVRRLAAASDQVAQIRKTGGKYYPGLWPGERMQYIQMLTLLRQVMKMSKGDDTGLICKTPEFFRDDHI